MNDIMDYCLAIPSAVIYSSKPLAYVGTDEDFYSNELSEPLGAFLVYPIKKFKIFHEDEKLRYGFFTVGYKEVITGKKIILNTFKENELGGCDAYLHDAESDIKPQAGDISWSVIDLNMDRDKIKYVDVKAYFKQTKNEVSEKLQKLHEQAREMGEASSNLQKEIDENTYKEQFVKQYMKVMKYIH